MECTLKLVARDGEECELYNYKDDSTYVVPCNWCLDGGSDQNVSDKEEGVITSTGPGVVVLGVLVGLLVVLLVAVITGWLWTCWVMKNRKTDSRYRTVSIIHCSLFSYSFNYIYVSVARILP